MTRAFQQRSDPQQKSGKRQVLQGLIAGGALLAQPAQALPGFRKDLVSKRKRKVPESEFTDGPEGLRFYDVEVGNGAEAKEGARVAVHYDAYWKGVTFMTSRQGMGVTGGTPIGFDVGAKEAGGTLRGLDLGVRGMRVGGQRKLILPPNLAYGERGIREIPPNATLTMDVQLLSIKQNTFGYRTKLVEG